jgi:Tfp pilus tip-associated adhesin PilY1
VVGDVFVINDSSGLAKWAYAADLGGNVYRISGVTANEPIGDADPSDWTLTKVAAVGCATPGTCTDGRKFMFMPDIVEKNGTYYLLVGSGDREKPLLGLNPHEQVVTSAITVFGTTTFSTHTPTVLNPGACVSNLGTARVYNIGFANARSRNGTSDRSQVISGGGLPPSPVAGLVTLDDGRTVPFLIGGDPDSPLETVLPTRSGDG